MVLTGAVERTVKAESLEVQVGAVLQGRYEVLGLLGEGGFSRVYRARQHGTGQEVAVKVLLPRWAEDSTQLARFRREMELCARLYHPNIVRLLDGGRTEQGVLYSVFDLVPGRTLAEVLAEQGRLEPKETVHLMGQVLDALACAHQRGVIHRDLKPHNLMVTAEGVRRNALVLDFGLGTLSEAARREEVARLTLTHEALGTPAYAAPELLRGEEASARSDLYAWALILLECVTGRRVMEGRTLHEVLHKQLGAQVVGVPELLRGWRLGQLLERVLSKEPAARDVEAAELMRALEAWHPEGWEEEPAGAAERRVVPVGPPVAEGGQRQLTALCLELEVGGPGLESLDTEDVDRLLRAQHEACLKVARSFQAHVGGVLGERVLLYFGYPQAQEGDSRRAARAALALAKELGTRAQELAARHGLTLEWRLGLHTGLVLGEEDPSPRRRSPLAGRVGLTLQVAARLEELAEPGTILVSEEVARLLGARFSLEPAGSHAVPGRVRPLEVLRLEGEAHQEPTPSFTPDGTMPPLSGRGQELELLLTRWRQAAAGRGQVLLLSGEPGIGKSRLVRELSHSVAGEHQRLECRCAPESRHSALQPVMELVGRLAGASADQPPLPAGLEALLERLGLDKAAYLPLLAAVLGLPPSESYPLPQVEPQRLKELSLEALVALVGALAEQKPLLLVVEDLHWADPTTLELLGLLAQEAPSLPLCLLGTARPDLSLSWPGSHVLQVQLGRLEAPQVEQLVQAAAGGKPLPAEVVAQIVQRADGVPLFAEELARMILESGVLEAGPEGWRLVAPLSTLAVPAMLRDLLTARLDRLGAAQETAQLASALGREFSAEVLLAASGRSEAALQKDLAALMGAGLVYRRRSGRGLSYLFKHALVRDTAYASLSKPARRQVHARIAAVLEERFPELVQGRPELLALHHAAAEQKRQALGYARRAAEAALQRYANLEAIAHASEALGWLEAVEEERERAQVELQLNQTLTSALLASRSWTDEAIPTHAERALHLIEQLGDGPHTLPALHALQTYYHMRGLRPQAWAIAERLAARQWEDPGEQVVALLAAGCCLWVEGRPAESESYLRRVLELCPPGSYRDHAFTFSMDSRVSALAVLAQVLWLRGQDEQSTALRNESLAYARELNHANTLGLAYLYALMSCQQRGQPQELRALLEEMLALAQQKGLPLYAEYGRLMRAWLERDAETLDQGTQAVAAWGLETGLSYYTSLLVDVELALGRHESALQHARQGVERARTGGEQYYLAELLRLQGLALHATGAPAQAARDTLLQAVHVARQQGAHLLALRAALSLARLQLPESTPGEGQTLLSSILEKFGNDIHLPELAEARALAAGSWVGDKPQEL